MRLAVRHCGFCMTTRAHGTNKCHTYGHVRSKVEFTAKLIMINAVLILVMEFSKPGLHVHTIAFKANFVVPMSGNCKWRSGTLHSCLIQ